MKQTLTDPGEAKLQQVIAGTDPNPGVSAAALANLQEKTKPAFASEANRIGTALQFEQMDPQISYLRPWRQIRR